MQVQLEQLWFDLNLLLEHERIQQIKIIAHPKLTKFDMLFIYPIRRTGKSLDPMTTTKLCACLLNMLIILLRVLFECLSTAASIP
jgi:hypothetical protein